MPVRGHAGHGEGRRGQLTAGMLQLAHGASYHHATSPREPSLEHDMQLTAAPAPIAPAAAAPVAAAPTAPAANPAVDNPIVGIFTPGQQPFLIRSMGTLGPDEGFASTADAVAGLAALTMDADTTAGIVQRDGRFHGIQLGLTSVMSLPQGALDKAPSAWGMRNDLFGSQAVSIDLVAPDLVGLVDGGFNANNSDNGGVALLGRRALLDAAHASQLMATHRTENAGKLVDLTELAARPLEA